MRGKYKNTFRNKVLEKISSLKRDVILWPDLTMLGNPRQISRALNDCIKDGVLARIGRGIYAKTTFSQYTEKPVIRVGFDVVCIQVLNRLKIKWKLSKPIQDYNAGLSQQIPANFEVRLKSRFRRKIIYG